MPIHPFQVQHRRPHVARPARPDGLQAGGAEQRQRGRPEHRWGCSPATVGCLLPCSRSRPCPPACPPGRRACALAALARALRAGGCSCRQDPRRRLVPPRCCDAADNHRAGPHANLFSNLDFGANTRPFKSGGRKDRVRACSRAVRRRQPHALLARGPLEGGARLRCLHAGLGGVDRGSQGGPVSPSSRPCWRAFFAAGCPDGAGLCVLEPAGGGWRQLRRHQAAKVRLRRFAGLCPQAAQRQLGERWGGAPLGGGLAAQGRACPGSAWMTAGQPVGLGSLAATGSIRVLGWRAGRERRAGGSPSGRPSLHAPTARPF